MNKNDFVYDTLIFPLADNPIQRNLITVADKVDCVIELDRQDRCVVVVNTMKYNVELSAQKVCEMIYGGINNEDQD